MAVEVDDSDQFQADFSTKSDWEVFNAALGEVFQKWDLVNSACGREPNKGELFTCNWHVDTEELNVLKKCVAVSYYVADLPDIESSTEAVITEPSKFSPTNHPLHRDLMSVHNSFGPLLKATNSNGDSHSFHSIVRFYGLRRFVVVYPSQQNQRTQFFSNPNEFSFFLSSVTVVAAELCSTVPIFVQIYDPRWDFYIGVGFAPALRTNFNVVSLKHAPTDCCYLTGLLSMFKEKFRTTYLRPATVSIRNTYSLDTIRLRISMRVPFSQAPTTEEEQAVNAALISASQFIPLPYGYFPDSCTEVYAGYTWPEIVENIAIDSEMHSDFVPSKAPTGSIHLVAHAISYLSTGIRDFQKLCGSSDALESFVGRHFSGVASATEIENPLDKLTSPPHLRNLSAYRESKNHSIGKQQTIKKLPGPMNDNEMNQMLLYLFPDMHNDVLSFPYSEKSFKHQFDPLRIKSSTPDSLVSRLSCLLATCNAHFGGKSGLAQLWAAFTRELRCRWDFGLPIPGVAPGFPDTRTCLLHQKLQLLNVCIQRREGRGGVDSSRYAMELKPSPNKMKSAQDADSSAELTEDIDEEDDEFFDCPNYEEPSPNKPEGRQKCLGDLKLLEDHEEAIYIPVTQEPVPKTEDQLLEDAAVMLKLGPGSGITTQMMCSSLLSDMEAFKAANPKAKMEDFIRWYSPKDWEETADEDGKTEGKLSARMLSPDNTWQNVWKKAQAVPVWRQKRLFDDTNEALKVLHYMETRNINEIYELAVIPMLHSALLKLMDIFENSSVLDIFRSQIDALLNDLCRLSREFEVSRRAADDEVFTEVAAMANVEPIIQQIETLETSFYQFKCFERMCEGIKLEDVKCQFKEILENNGSCNIVRRKSGVAIGEGDGIWNPNYKNEMRENLISKDYIIRLDGETTDNATQSGAQFLRAIVTGEKVRLCGAFTQSTVFV